VVRSVLVALAVSLLGFAAVTGLALESGGVAVLETRAPDGTPRTTRVWVADEDGSLLVEAASAERPWYRDVLLDPMVSLKREGRVEAFRALPEPGDAGHRRVRELLRARYGWRDAWVGLVQDTSGSIAVRLEPLESRF
jgi:F420H(2)-dependent quinone reductase